MCRDKEIELNHLMVQKEEKNSEVDR
jgi:hypothetical protein